MENHQSPEETLARARAANLPFELAMEINKDPKKLFGILVTMLELVDLPTNEKVAQLNRAVAMFEAGAGS